MCPLCGDYNGLSKRGKSRGEGMGKSSGKGRNRGKERAGTGARRGQGQGQRLGVLPSAHDVAVAPILGSLPNLCVQDNFEDVAMLVDKYALKA